MDRYCVMGNPVGHSKSPWIHTRFAELTGQSLQYVARLVPLDGFAQAVHAFQGGGGRGCNITVPFKFEAAALAGQGLTPRAALAGACNTLRFDGAAVLGDNTDGVGLVHDIVVNAGVALAGRRVLLIGAGGAAAGVLGPLLQARPATLTITNRTPDKARQLALRHAALAEAEGVQLVTAGIDDPGTGHDVVINGTASSLGGDDVPVPGGVLRQGALACDMMYGPAARGFLDWAASHGAVPRDGLGMLVEQAAEAFRIWRGVRPPSAQVLAELRERMSRGAA
ncbi:MAG: shikimate dehydrogenase [Pseudomonadota bacterium]